MSIVNLKKLTVLALASNKHQVIDQLQEFSGLHINSLREKKLAPAVSGLTDIQNLRTALMILEQAPNPRPFITKHSINPAELVDEILHVRQSIEQTREAILKVIDQIHTLQPWGDFLIPDSETLGGNMLWFYRVPTKNMHKVSAKITSQIVGKDNMYTYLVVIAKQEPTKKDLPVLRTKIGGKRLAVLEIELDALQASLEDLYDRRRFLTQYRFLLAQHISEFEDITDRESAYNSTRDDAELFILSAWVADNDLERFKNFCYQRKIAYVVEDPAVVDKVPTLLENNEYFDTGELLVDFYQSPGYETVDPSAIVFVSFSLFFSMIMADAGYGIILSIIYLYNYKKIKKSKHGRQLVNLFSTLCVMSVLYGVFVGNYFGVVVQADSLLGQLAFIKSTDFNFMMRLSIYIGIGHIILANLIIAFKTKYMYQKIKSIAFAVLVGSGLIYILTENMTLTLGSLSIGILMLIFGSADQKVVGLKSLFLKIIKGSLSVTSITSLFGDIMSYMRLFALGIAGSSLAATFNQLADNMYHSSAGVGVLIALIILVFGHGLNFLLTIMSGVVHGLRLNYIEFFHWSIPDEGVKFKKFRKRGDISYE